MIPEKWVPVFPSDKREAFARRSCSNQKMKQDDDSKKSHPAPGRSGLFRQDSVEDRFRGRQHVFRNRSFLRFFVRRFRHFGAQIERRTRGRGFGGGRRGAPRVTPPTRRPTAAPRVKLPGRWPP